METIDLIKNGDKFVDKDGNIILRMIDGNMYIHDFVEVIKFKMKDGKIKEKWIGLDSDKAGTLMHIYMNPDMIIVRQK